MAGLQRAGISSQQPTVEAAINSSAEVSNGIRDSNSQQNDESHEQNNYGKDIQEILSHLKRLPPKDQQLITANLNLTSPLRKRKFDPLEEKKMDLMSSKLPASPSLAKRRNSKPIEITGPFPPDVLQNPSKRATYIDSIKPEGTEIDEVVITKRNSVLVFGKNSSEYGKFLGDNWKSNDEGHFSPKIPAENSIIQSVVIRGVDRSISEDEIREQLQKAGFNPVEVSRIRGGLDQSPTFSVKATFSTNSEYDKIISEGCNMLYKNHKCQKFQLLPGASQCYRCQQFNHQSSQCQAQTSVCARCAGDHRLSACPQPNDRSKIICPNCKEAGHQANYKGCKKFREATSSFRSSLLSNTQPKAHPGQMAPNFGSMSYAQATSGYPLPADITQSHDNDRNQEDFTLSILVTVTKAISDIFKRVDAAGNVSEDDVILITARSAQNIFKCNITASNLKERMGRFSLKPLELNFIPLGPPAKQRRSIQATRGRTNDSSSPLHDQTVLKNLLSPRNSTENPRGRSSTKAQSSTPPSSPTGKGAPSPSGNLMESPPKSPSRILPQIPLVQPKINAPSSFQNNND
jgi:hypothetical protein